MGVATGGNIQDNSGPPQPSLLSEINDWMQQTGLVSSFGLGLKVIKKNISFSAEHEIFLCLCCSDIKIDKINGTCMFCDIKFYE